MMRVEDLQRNVGASGREKVRCVSNTDIEKNHIFFFQNIAQLIFCSEKANK
jgi:hypothetical protein